MNKGELIMKPLFFTYPKCSTCFEAKKYLESMNIDFDTRDIMTQTPTVNELKEWITKSNMPIKKFFNVTGNMYKEMNMKEKLVGLSEEEMIEILASSGWLIKRPLLISDKGIIVGFHEEMYDILK